MSVSWTTFTIVYNMRIEDYTWAVQPPNKRGTVGSN